MSRSSADVNAVVHLTSSTQLQSNTALPAAVAHWTLTDVQQHVFFMAWVCGFPVHARYVAQLLQRSVVGVSHSASTRADWIDVAQRDVLMPVYERGTRVNAAVCRWPASEAFAPTPSSLSFLVPLGIAEGVAAAPTITQGEDEASKLGTFNGTGEIRATAKPDNANNVVTDGAERQEDRRGALPSSSSSSSAIQAVAVVPDALFTNVTALALYSAVEADTAQNGSIESSYLPKSSAASTALPRAPVNAAWCSRAYWTAVSHAKQWIELLSWTSSAPVPSFPPRTLQPAPTAEPASGLRERKRRRSGGVPPATEAFVVVDAEEDDGGENEVDARHAAAPLLHDLSAEKMPSRVNASAAKSAREEEDAVIIIDSDDE